MQQQYVLGSSPEELARLDAQAAAIDRPTRLLLQAAGITPGMRVLDLGTGLGHVAQIAGEFVGPAGSVVGLDNAPEVLALARERAQYAGARTLTFVEGSAGSWRSSDLFDAIVARLLLFHVADPEAIVRHHLQNLRPGGLLATIDFDLGPSRAEPQVPIVDDALRWVHQAFRAAGGSPRIGARLGAILEDAGLQQVSTFGIQPYVRATAPGSGALLAGVVRSLAPVIVANGIATAAQLRLDHLQERIERETRRVDAVILLPTVVGAWGRSVDTA
jgi:SAM-dependent methyltransferase